MKIVIKRYPHKSVVCLEHKNTGKLEFNATTFGVAERTAQKWKSAFEELGFELPIHYED